MPIDYKFCDAFLSENGIDLKKHRLLVSMGRAVKRKGFSWFVQQVLPKLDESVRYLIIGPINNRKSIFDRILEILPSNMSNQLSLLFGHPTDSEDLAIAIANSHGKAIHTGPLKFGQLMSLIALAEIKLMPNIKINGDMEGFGLVALEAGLRNTYVIASKLEGISCAIQHNESGLLVESQAVSVWLEAINTCLADRKALALKSAKAKEYVLSNYSWERMCDAYITHFNQLIERYQWDNIVFKDKLNLI